MANKVPRKTGMLIYLPVTSRPRISLQKEAVLSPCNFATTHLTACILNFYLHQNFAIHESEDATGGLEKRGGWKTSRMTPLPKRGFGPPPRTVRFPPRSGVSALFFLYKNPRQSRPEALLEGSQIFGGARSLFRFPPPIRFTSGPHITAQMKRRTLSQRPNPAMLASGASNMPFVKCLSGFAEVPYQVPPWSLPDAPRMPKNKSKEAYLVPAPKARLYHKVLVAQCLPGSAEGPYQGQPLSGRKSFKNVPWHQVGRHV